jgi:uncharacterized membrane protein HdeD (DUF308 family)
MNLVEDIIEPIRAVARTIFILGIVLVILGILSILAPWASGLAVQGIIGLLMIAGGITWIIFAFHAHGWGSGLWEALVGVLAVATGVLMLGHPVVGLQVLTLILSAYFIATGILKAVFAFKFNKLKSWGWILFNGIMSVILGVLIIYQWPFSGLWAIGVLFGVDLLCGGFSLIQIGSSAERYAR